MAGEVVDLHNERFLRVSPFDSDKKLARIAVSFDLDLGASPSEGAMETPSGALIENFNGGRQIVPVHLVDRVEVETEQQLALAVS